MSMDPQKNDRELEELLDRALKSYSDAQPSWGFEERILARAKNPAVRDAQGRAPRRWWAGWPAWAAVAAMIVVAAVLPFAMRTKQQRRFETKVASVQQPKPAPSQESAPYVAADRERSEPIAKSKARIREKAPAREDIRAVEKKDEVAMLAKSAPMNADATRRDMAMSKAAAPPLAPSGQAAVPMSAPAESANTVSTGTISGAMKNAPAAGSVAMKKLARAESPRHGVFPSPSPMTAQERALLAMASTRPREAAQFARSEASAAKEASLAISDIQIEPLKVPELEGGLK